MRFCALACLIASFTPFAVGSPLAVSAPLIGSSVPILSTLPPAAPVPVAPELPGAAVLQAANARAVTAASVPAVLSFIQCPPRSQSSGGPERCPVEPPTTLEAGPPMRLSLPLPDRPFGGASTRGRGRKERGRWRASCRESGAAPNGAQVAAEAMPYDRDRRTDCKAGRS